MRPASIVCSLPTTQKHSSAVTTDQLEAIVKPNSTQPLLDGNIPLLFVYLLLPSPITITSNGSGPQAPTHDRTFREQRFSYQRAT